MKNPYKRHDIFQCRHESHARFDYNVSAYHVLRVKNCYPQGCLFFRWKCELLNKGKSCIRKYSHIGRKCFGCKYFYDEKMNYHPELQISEGEYHNFLEELEEFEDWLESIRCKHIDCWATIRSVKPRLKKVYTNRESSISLDGYIISFSEAYVGLNHWEDFCYAIVYGDQQERFRFGARDEIEFMCRVDLAEGRLVFNKLRAVEFNQKFSDDIWTNSRSLVARETATLFKEQPAKCRQCKSGVLVDVLDKTSSHWVRRRELYCLESMRSPEMCYKVTIDQDEILFDGDCRWCSN